MRKLVGHKWLGKLVTEYWIKKRGHLEQTSQSNEIKAFKLLWLFLDYESTKYKRTYSSCDSLDARFVSRLISWMSSRTITTKLSDQTKASRYNKLKLFFEWLKHERKMLPPNWPIRANPWPLSHKKVTSSTPLSEPELRRVLDAARTEIIATLDRWKSTKRILNDRSIEIPHVDANLSAYVRKDVAVKALRHSYPGIIPKYKDVKKARHGLIDAIRIYENYRMDDLIECLYPTARTLVPFVVLIGMSTIFNPQTLLRLRWSEVSDSHPIFGSDRWRISADKRRGGKRQVRSFPAKVTDIGNPVVLLRHLKEQTEPLRSSLPEPFKSKVFIYHYVNGTKRYGSFESKSAGRWQTALSSFIAENNLSSFALVNLRATGSELIDEITGGDIRAQQVLLNHARVETTEMHYTSSISKHRRQETLATRMSWQERYIRTVGKSDSRGKLGSRRAVTPGYECLDPYDSPMKGEVVGRMCAAFGFCPICPLKALNIGSQNDLAKLKQFERRLVEAKETVAPARWNTVWYPVYRALLKDIDLYPVKIKRNAENLNLPPFPTIE